MNADFSANSLPVLIGSLPVSDHEEAIQHVLKYTPEIPLWVQLPFYKKEGMIVQFMPGMPGAKFEEEKEFIDTSDENFDNDVLKFYEEYMAVLEGNTDLFGSRFSLTEDEARGFFVFLEHIKTFPAPPTALKGQITGPLTFCTSLNDQDGRAIFYNDQLRDIAVKLLALKAKWQARKLAESGYPVIIFLDEPALAGFGSSALISISKDEIIECFNEVIEAVHEEGGLAGVHVCANADWSLIFDSKTDIISFDAYSFFDKFILYPDQLKDFFEAGRILAWGIVPTLHAEDIDRETTDSLVANWKEKALKLENLGIAKDRIFAQSLISPSCGTGSLSIDHAIKVLKLTRQVSERLREEFAV